VVGGQVLGLAAVRVHGENLKIPIPVRLKDDLVPIDLCDPKPLGLAHASQYQVAIVLARVKAFHKLPDPAHDDIVAQEKDERLAPQKRLRDLHHVRQAKRGFHQEGKNPGLLSTRA
jgi:hypothetical protein